MDPSAGQTGENEGKACPQCGLINYAEANFCYNCRYPLKSAPLLTAGRNGAAHAVSGNGKAAQYVPLVLEHARQVQKPRRKRYAVPWGMIILSWGLLGTAWAINRYAQNIADSGYLALAFLVAMLAVWTAAALLRQHGKPARVSGWLLIVVYAVLQVLAIRAMF